MKDGKIDVKSVGITIALAIGGVCVGLYDFITQKQVVMDFLAESANMQPTVIGGADVWTNTVGFGGVIVCVLFVAFAMFSIRSMA